MDNEPTLPQLVIVSGLSGSGKSVALNTLEDLDFYCVDNLPAALLPDFVENILGSEAPPSRLAVGIDVRNRSGDLADLPEILSRVGGRGLDPRLLYFDTTTEVLLKRYSETRRRHPLGYTGLALTDAIVLERQVMRPVRVLADVIIDTSELNVHQLRQRVRSEFMSEDGDAVSLLFQSFAYRRGLPADADFVFDARVLPNPHWEPTLRPLSGRDAPVRDYLDAQPEVRAYLQQVTAFLDDWIPRFESGTRSYVTVAFGCSGGRHRSVYLAETLTRHFREQGREHVLSYHRELE